MMFPALLAAALAKAPAGEVLTLTLGAASLRAYVADAPEERSQGLMGVTELATDEGMVFVYPAARELTFWMKNTPTPLSIAYVGADGRVISIKDMKPFDTTLVLSDGAALYAVEAHQGWFAANGVSVGAVVGGLPGPAPK
jgi:uncharacterized membrane protein (UPF0127 family)